MILNRDQLKEVFGVDYYDGSQIHSRFAYKCFKDKTLPIGNVISFVSPTIVETAFMVDVEDRIAKDYIYSDKMINFCYELPMTNVWGGVAFQRLFNTMIGDTLAEMCNLPVEIEGDDIFVRKEFNANGVIISRGKSSVSIVTERQGAVVGHTGINIIAGSKAPSFAYSTNMTDEQALAFQRKCVEIFYQTANSIFIASAKVI